MKADRINITRVKDQLCTPVLATLMHSRWIIALLATAAALQAALTATGLVAWQCPLKSALGVTGPGCGLTKAIVLLAKGQWQASVHLHAFAPIGLGIGILLLAGSLLPARLRHRSAKRLAVFERRTAIAAWLMLSAIAYWIGRTMI